MILAGVTAAVKFLCTSCTEILLLFYSIIWSKCFSLRHYCLSHFRWFTATLTNVKDSTYSEAKHFLCLEKSLSRSIFEVFLHRPLNCDFSETEERNAGYFFLSQISPPPSILAFFCKPCCSPSEAGDRLTTFVYCGSPFEG